MTPVVVGFAQTKTERHPSAGIHTRLYQCVLDALADASLPKERLDAIYSTPAPLAGHPSVMFACEFGEYFQVSLKGLCQIECGGSSAMAAMKLACREIEAGRIESAVVFGYDYTALERPDQDFEAFMQLALWSLFNLYQHDGLYGLGGPLPFYAMCAQRYMHRYGIRPEQVATLAVTLREHAAKHPLAMFQDPLTVEEVLGSPMLSPPIHLLEASRFCGGAAAVVVVSDKMAADLRKTGAEVLAIGEHHDSSHFAPRFAPMERFVAARLAAQEAFQQTGLSPTDIDVAELQGVFAPTEMVLYEELGFCGEGEGGRWTQARKNSYGGDVVVNPSGGRLSFGYPPVAAPLQQVGEIYLHLTNQAGERQVPGAEHGLVHAEHGMMNGCFVGIFQSHA